MSSLKNSLGTRKGGGGLVPENVPCRQVFQSALSVSYMEIGVWYPIRIKRNRKQNKHKPKICPNIANISLKFYLNVKLFWWGGGGGEGLERYMA